MVIDPEEPDKVTIDDWLKAAVLTARTAKVVLADGTEVHPSQATAKDESADVAEEAGR